jgi:hypothetical protein
MKYLFTLILTFCTVYCYCQIEKPTTKGNIVLGGNAGFAYNSGSSEAKLFFPGEESHSLEYDQKSAVFSFGPNFGYFVADGLVVGVSPSFSYNKQESSGLYNSNAFSIGISPFIKYYLNNGLFLGLEPGYHYSVSEQEGVVNKTKSNRISINPSFGYAIFINSKVSLEPSIEYSFEKTVQKDETDFDYDSKNNRIFFNIGFHIFL